MQQHPSHQVRNLQNTEYFRSLNVAIDEYSNFFIDLVEVVIMHIFSNSVA